MKTKRPVPANPRLRIFFAYAGFYLAACLLLRAALLVEFGAAQSAGAFPRLFLTGLRLDLAAAAWLFLPLALWLGLLPERAYASRPNKAFLRAAFAFYVVGQLFALKVEQEFFREFNARFNTVAVDYLVYPHETFVNIWDSYPVVKVLAACLALGLLADRLSRGFLRHAWEAPASKKARLRFVGAYLAVALLCTQTVSFSCRRWSQDRVLNEVSSNGLYSLVHAAWSHNLDFPAFYRTLPREEACARARALVSQPGAVFESSGTIRRDIPGDPRKKPANLVVILVESFGSEFWGALGRPGPSLTPRMDALSREGLFFTHLYASGNRTVRGMEGVLSSFPPLPGDSIVKRPMSDNVATLARTLQGQGYETVFIYGGRGLFDGMRSFTTRNGYARFVEQKDFPHPAFTTTWGVSDEDILHRSLEEFRALHRSGRPFFATVLTVSNHKPYTYPPGRIPENPDEHRREWAVKYTDWALGEFFRKAKSEAFYKDTIFAVVADHGARVYGSQSIPIHSYEIPLVILGGAVKNPRRVATLGSSLDVGPTLLGLWGRPYTSIFFGRDLLAVPPGRGWAVMNHNRDIGLYKDSRMAVLGMNKTLEFYRMNPSTRLLEPARGADAADGALAKDASALFQVADELYTREQYR